MELVSLKEIEACPIYSYSPAFLVFKQDTSGIWFLCVLPSNPPKLSQQWIICLIHAITFHSFLIHRQIPSILEFHLLKQKPHLISMTHNLMFYCLYCSLARSCCFSFFFCPRVLSLKRKTIREYGHQSHSHITCLLQFPSKILISFYFLSIKPKITVEYDHDPYPRPHQKKGLVLFRFFDLCELSQQQQP